MGSFWGPMGLRFRPDGVLGGHLGSQGGQGASNLVRGSPKGAPKGCQIEPKSDQIELRNRESYGLGATKRKMYIEVCVFVFSSILGQKSMKSYQHVQRIETRCRP